MNVDIKQQHKAKAMSRHAPHKAIPAPSTPREDAGKAPCHMLICVPKDVTRVTVVRANTLIEGVHGIRTLSREVLEVPDGWLADVGAAPKTPPLPAASCSCQPTAGVESEVPLNEEWV